MRLLPHPGQQEGHCLSSHGFLLLHGLWGRPVTFKEALCSCSRRGVQQSLHTSQCIGPGLGLSRADLRAVGSSSPGVPGEPTYLCSFAVRVCHAQWPSPAVPRSQCPQSRLQAPRLAEAPAEAPFPGGCEDPAPR